MLNNYLTITFRNLLRQKVYSFLNLFGLALGISCSLIILLWVHDELNMDGFHQYKGRLYRIMENQSYTNGSVFTFASTPGPMAPVIKEKYAEIEFASRVTWPETRLFQAADKSFYQEGRFVDPDFLLMLTFPLAEGDVKTALNEMYSVVISKKMAQKFFGQESALGKTLTMPDQENFVVTGVLEEIPASSSIQFDFLIPFAYFYKNNESWLQEWGNNNIRTNIVLAENADVEAFKEKIRYEIKTHTDESNNIELFIQPLHEAYLYGKFENGKLVGGRIEYVRIFLVVAILVLLIASINFMNLTTAQAAKRAKEVGLRKTLGAFRGQLASQFLGESMVMVFLSSVIGLGMAYLLLPIFNEIAGKQLSLTDLSWSSVIIFLAVVIVTGMVSGSYPAIYISRFQPVRVLKGQLQSGRSASRFRKLLVVVQFSLSIVLIISTVIVFKQMNFIQQKDIGLERNQVIYMWMRGDMKKHQDVIRDGLRDNSAIESVTLSNANPINFGNSTSNLVWEGKDPNEQILFSNFSVDYEFVDMMKMQIVEGRSFDREFPTDTANFIINEAAKKVMGFDQAAGQPLTVWGERVGKIVGVVKDFHFQSVHSKVEPLFMMLDPDWFNVLFVRYKEGQAQQAIQALEKINKQYAAAYPFEYDVLDDDWNNLYKTEDRVGKLFNYFAALSIAISCLGLFGLSAYSAEQRTKELGVRKVMGASVPSLVRHMAKDFAVLISIAIVIGCPAGWYVMDGWLQGYAYHIEMGFDTLAWASVICLVIAMGTVSYHSIRVSLANPVNSLRYE